MVPEGVRQTASTCSQGISKADGFAVGSMHAEQDTVVYVVETREKQRQVPRPWLRRYTASLFECVGSLEGKRDFRVAVALMGAYLWRGSCA